MMDYGVEIMDWVVASLADLRGGFVLRINDGFVLVAQEIFEVAYVTLGFFGRLTSLSFILISR